MLQTALALAAPLKMLTGLESGRLLMHPTDYRAIVLGIQARLDTLSTEQLVRLAHDAGGTLGEMAEAAVFERAWCLVLGERQHRIETERVFDALMGRLLGPTPR